MNQIKILILISLFSTATIFGQSSSYSDDDWETYVDWEWEWDQHPFMEISYGFGDVKHKKFSSEFSKIGLVELKLGFLNQDQQYEDYIVKFRGSYFFVSNLSTDLKSGKSTAAIPTDMWRFGFGRAGGYGYKFSDVAILPYWQGAFVWSRLNPEDPFTLPAEDVKILDRYRDNFRFGTSNEAGIRLEFANFISINGGFETSVVFPRHVFWKHAGSFAIETIGHGMIDYFVNEIIDSTPEAAPIVNFLLHNGLSYAFYSLKRDNMNWPFQTETPLTYETVKLGMTFTF